ncbi:MAG TPA: hypothetical protein VEU30_14360 [Thermoanaerobaculia bacterium]|nr:hypothetical protein [Thermoanaerobaculia bacterium]
MIIGIVIVAFLLLMGLPFGGREEGPARTASVETETIAEGTAPSSPGPASTGTLIDVDEVPPQPAAPTTTTVAPAPAPATTTTAAPPPTRVERPATEPPPMTSAAPPPSREGEIDEEEAISTLRGYLVTRNYYQTGAGCLTVSSEGYANVGYTLNVRDRCGSRALGRWRVDAKTREVFRQRDDGRFLRP